MSSCENVLGSPWGCASETLNVPQTHLRVCKHADSESAGLAKGGSGYAFPTPFQLLLLLLL